MAFINRQISLTIRLGKGNFGDTGFNTVTIPPGSRCSVQITKGGNPAADFATIRVWGLTKTIMNSVTDLGKPLSRQRINTVTVSVGDPVVGMSEVYAGTIMAAYGDFSDPPNAALMITGLSNVILAAQPVKPLSFAGGTDAVTVFQTIATNTGRNLINWGVQGLQLASPYLPGTAKDQIERLAQAVGVHYALNDGDQPSIEIWPMNGIRGGPVPLVSPSTGLVGYPNYCDEGIALKALYQPGFNINGKFMLETSIHNAQGSWQVLALDYDLESEMPDGQWFVNITAQRPGDAATTAGSNAP